MAFLNETGLATFLAYLKAWSRSQFVGIAEKSKIDNLGAVFRFRGGVSTPASLPASAENGDVYAVENPASVYAWDGAAWLDLGFGDALVPMTSAQVSAIFEE